MIVARLRNMVRQMQRALFRWVADLAANDAACDPTLNKSRDGSAIDGRATHRAGYAIRQRKCVEPIHTLHLEWPPKKMESGRWCLEKKSVAF